MKHNYQTQLSKHGFFPDDSNFIELPGKDTQMMRDTTSNTK